VRYSRDLAHLRAKIANIRTLADAGVEMGSHAVRHDHGRHWDLARWRHEIADDRRIAQLHGLPLPQGFRAPFLEWNEHTYTALAEHGYRYDVSQGGGHAWPARDPRTGLWVFTMPHVGLPGRDEPVLYFDENVRRLLGAEARRRGLHGAAAQRWMDDAYVDAGLDEFERRYRGNRAPFVVGGHGVFRDAATRLMREVCPRPNVRCATFREAVDYLEAHPELAGAPALHGQRTLAFRRPRQAVR
jgi:peptidoglycan/xylan/chitin deacetylase (PgdA/CDA1 family)